MIKISLQTLKKIPKYLLIIFFILLFLNILVIVIRHVTGHFSIFGVMQLFDFDVEHNIPTYFSSVNLLIASILLFFIYRLKKNNSQTDSKYWITLSVIFLVLSIDEAVVGHELLVRPTWEVFDFTRGLNVFAWVIPGIIICLILLLFFLKFYLKLAPRYKLLFGISALLFIGGVFGLEIAGSPFYPEEESFSLVYSLFTTIEESFEMTGIILFIYSLIKYMHSETNTTNYEI